MTNGMAHKYVPSVGSYAKIDLNPNAEVFKVKPGEPTRWFIFNGGPNDGVAFHFISGIINVHDGSVQNRYGTQALGEETWWVPPGSGSVLEVTFPDEGIYVGVDHAMNDVLKGGAFAVLATANSTATDHPAGTMVPPKGSDLVSGPPAVANATAGNATSGAAANATEAAAEPAAQNQTLSVVNATGTGTNATNLAVGAPDTAADLGLNATSGGATSGTNATTGAATTGAAATTGGAATTGPAATSNGSTTGTNGTSSGATGGGTSVSIVPGSSSLTDTAFQPNPVSVKVGDTITWTNNDSQPHTVVSGANGTPDGKFDSSPNFNPLIVPGGTFEHTFTEAGEYPYYCALHPNMVGTVSVS
ncbi:MAG: plastocyanin/azurin family copper-binding protein [Thermoproteota archaeon]|nr:plastocyanin/azurin family copper-binding protein [Thermoproteota archaeon]